MSCFSRKERSRNWWDQRSDDKPMVVVLCGTVTRQSFIGKQVFHIVIPSWLLVLKKTFRRFQCYHFGSPAHTALWTRCNISFFWSVYLQHLCALRVLHSVLILDIEHRETECHQIIITPCGSGIHRRIVGGLEDQIISFPNPRIVEMGVPKFDVASGEWPVDLLPSSRVAHDNYSGGDRIPVTDLSNLQCTNPNRDDIKCTIEHMVSASKDWGFLKVINHGVPQKIIKRVRGRSTLLVRIPFGGEAEGEKRRLCELCRVWKWNGSDELPI